jgi:two-component system cell cycle sensor histidine kinase/response regulator CckA
MSPAQTSIIIGTPSERVAVTQRLRLERARASSEERYRLATEAVGGLVYEWTVETEQVVRSAGLYHVTGYHPEEATPHRKWWLSRIHPDDIVRQQASFAEHRVNQKPLFEYEYRIIHRDGSVRHVLERSRLVFNEEGKLIRVVGCTVDMTAAKLLEEEIRYSQKMEAVGRLAGGIAHDFNNLLTIILGTTQLVANGLTEEDPLREDIEILRIAAKKASSIVDQLLTFSQRRSYSPRKIALDESIQALIPMVRPIVGGRVELATNLGAGDAMIYADSVQLEQAILNLVINARDAMPTGGRLTITTRQSTAAGSGDEVEIEICDTGIGIPDDVLPRIFEPFFTTKGPDEGTGLGLAVTHGIIEQMGGTIRVDSNVDQGTQVLLLLPSVKSEE